MRSNEERLRSKKRKKNMTVRINEDQMRSKLTNEVQ